MYLHVLTTQSRLKTRRSDTARSRSQTRAAGVTKIENCEGGGVWHVFWGVELQVEVIISKMILRELQVEVIIKSGTR